MAYGFQTFQKSKFRLAQDPSAGETPFHIDRMSVTHQHKHDKQPLTSVTLPSSINVVHGQILSVTACQCLGRDYTNAE